MELLLAAGADSTLVRADNKLGPLAIARKNNRDDLVAILSNYSAPFDAAAAATTAGDGDGASPGVVIHPN